MSINIVHPSQLDALVREGLDQKVRQFFEELKIVDIPREHRAEYADIARRIGLSFKSLRILSAIIRPINPIAVPANDREKLVYGASLCRVGAFREASQLFSEICVEAEPEVEFFKTYPLISEWRYAESIVYLKSFVGNPKISDYRRFVGRVNLAAALVNTGKKKQAHLFLEILISDLQKTKNYLLLGNALEMACQLALQDEKFVLADDLAGQAETYLQHSPNYVLMLKKWKHLSLLRASKKKGNLDQAILSSFQNLKEQALALSNWETFREIDFHTALLTDNSELFLKVFFGTQSQSYRKMMVQKLALAIPETYVWCQTDKYQTIFDLNSQETVFKSKSLLRKLFIILTWDMYRPLLIGQLFGLMFPEEYFNPLSSPTRVAQLVWRLNQVLKFYHLDIRVINRTQGYSLHLGAHVGISLKLVNRVPSVNPLVVSFKEKWHERFFTVNQVISELKISRAHAKRWLVQQLGNSTILRSGQGKNTRYYFVNKRIKEKKSAS